MRKLLLAPLLIALALAGCADNGDESRVGNDNDTEDGGASELNGQFRVVNDSTRETDETNPTPGGNESTAN